MLLELLMWPVAAVAALALIAVAQLAVFAAWSVVCGLYHFLRS